MKYTCLHILFLVLGLSSYAQPEWQEVRKKQVKSEMKWLKSQFFREKLSYQIYISAKDSLAPHSEPIQEVAYFQVFDGIAMYKTESATVLYNEVNQVNIYSGRKQIYITKSNQNLTALTAFLTSSDLKLYKLKNDSIVAYKFFDPKNGDLSITEVHFSSDGDLRSMHISYPLELVSGDELNRSNCRKIVLDYSFKIGSTNGDSRHIQQQFFKLLLGNIGEEFLGYTLTDLRNTK
jgi:hypothetical protein